MKPALTLFAAAAMLCLAATPAFAQPGPGRRALPEGQLQQGPRIDPDGDGFISRAEAKAGAERMYDSRIARSGQEGGARGGRRPFADLAEADRNGDGTLSREEFVTQQLRFFDAADANGDGRLKAPQRPAAPNQP